MTKEQAIKLQTLLQNGYRVEVNGNDIYNITPDEDGFGLLIFESKYDMDHTQIETKHVCVSICQVIDWENLGEI